VTLRVIPTVLDAVNAIVVTHPFDSNACAIGQSSVDVVKSLIDRHVHLAVIAHVALALTTHARLLFG
jgi:hypothetical protein